MSGDLRVMSERRFGHWIRQEMNSNGNDYCDFRIDKSQFHARTKEIDDTNAEYVRARIRLFGKGYIPAPNF